MLNLFWAGPCLLLLLVSLHFLAQLWAWGPLICILTITTGTLVMATETVAAIHEGLCLSKFLC